ncbi:DapH/DapD/GlmU-related protein [Streptomyces sp. NPDC059785]|uniref:DapH/DapD/GlmU-related protein n=1 Tax=unclassified Streptomyces TaxID=2593676 RepID=UPI0036696132
MGLTSGLTTLALRIRGANIGHGVTVGPGCRIEAQHIEIGDNVRIGQDVRLKAERLVIESDTYIGDGCRIQGQMVHLGYNCVVFPQATLWSLTHLRLGDHSKVSREAVLKAGSFSTGSEFWVNRRAEIGGGGWRKGEGCFQAGDRCHIGRNTHINTAEAVTLGDDTAVGMDCTIATHAHWQPVDDGFMSTRGPVALGANVAVYSRSIVSPGVTIADGGTVAGGSVVTHDVPERGLVGGAPSRLIRIQDRPSSPARLRIQAVQAFVRERWPDAHPGADGAGHYRLRAPNAVCDLDLNEDQVLSLVSRQPETVRTCWFDFEKRVLSGERSDLSEALRNHLFSYGIRFRYAGYRRSLLSYEGLTASGLED